MIKKFREITSKGERLSPEWRKDNVGETFRVVPIVGAVWEWDDEEVELTYSYNNPVTLVPDFSGVIAKEKNGDNRNELVFYEPDLRERFRISPPVVSEWSKPINARFYYVRLRNDGMWECIFNDGHDDYKAKLDVQTGRINDFSKTRV